MSTEAEAERKLERLLSELFDGDDPDAASAQLERLLLDQPRLRSLYWKSVNAHAALEYAGCLTDVPDRASDRRGPAAVRPPAGQRDRGLPGGLFGGHLAMTAAALALVVWVAVWSLAPRGGDVEVQALLDSAHLEPQRIPAVTHVSWEGPSFANHLDSVPQSGGLDPGPVTLHHIGGFDADGYLLRLPPGASLHLVATADATGENSLSVVEIGAASRPTTRQASFNNTGKGARPRHANPRAVGRRYGVLGTWSQSNDTNRPRYFLLTGVHKLAKPTPNEDWRLSRMHVMLEEPGMIHIGWDDSGPAPGESEYVYRRDDDFDDLSATVRILYADAAVASQGGPVRTSSEEAVVPVTAPDIAYRFLLNPGEAALLKGATEASLPNRLCVVEESSGSAVWVRSNGYKESANLNAKSIENVTAKPQHYAVYADHRESSDGDDAAWAASESELLYEQNGYVIVGFDDSRGDRDFNDVRVSVLKFSAQETATPVNND